MSCPICEYVEALEKMHALPDAEENRWPRALLWTHARELRAAFSEVQQQIASATLRYRYLMRERQPERSASISDDVAHVSNHICSVEASQ